MLWWQESEVDDKKVGWWEKKGPGEIPFDVFHPSGLNDLSPARGHPLRNVYGCYVVPVVLSPEWCVVHYILHNTETTLAIPTHTTYPPITPPNLIRYHNALK